MALAIGDLSLDTKAPLEYVVSNKVLNEAVYAILGHNQVKQDFSYQFTIDNDYPIVFDSTQMEGAVPDLASFIGYDVPLSMRIKNKGAPQFTFDEHQTTVQFSLEWEMWSEDFTTLFVSIDMIDILLDCDMSIQRNETTK
mmetsp:Transcript_16121/g.27257  ORF Transcript_16121/g.27257 Transcript_16121/m.27257 type:complete len:140 (+) Transcript_16121:857-1276(+)